MTFDQFIITILTAGYSFHYLNLMGHIDGIVVYRSDRTAGVIYFQRKCLVDNDWDRRINDLSENMQIVI